MRTAVQHVPCHEGLEEKILVRMNRKDFNFTRGGRTSFISAVAPPIPVALVPGAGGPQAAEVGVQGPDDLAAQQPHYVQPGQPAPQLSHHPPEVLLQQEVELALVAAQRPVPGKHVVPVAVIKN